MTYTPSKQELEDAALACGIPIPNGEDYYQLADGSIVIGYDHSGDEILWQPHLPTTQGKADLQVLQLAIPLDVRWTDSDVAVEGQLRSGEFVYEEVTITKGNKHAALAEAVIKVAAQLGAKIKE